MKQIFYLFTILLILSCKNEIYSDSEKLITSSDGNTSLIFKNSYSNGTVKDSLTGKLFDQAQVYSSKGKNNKAEKLYKRALQIEPNNIYIVNALGSINTNMRKFKTANKYFEKAIELDSLFPTTYLNYGFSRAHNDEFHKAIELYNKGVSLESHGERKGYFYYNISKAYYQLSDEDKAIIYVNKSLDLVSNEMIKTEILKYRKIIENK